MKVIVVGTDSVGVSRVNSIMASEGGRYRVF
jgi:hypothetical protein